MIKYTLFFLIILVIPIQAQSLFEEAVKAETGNQNYTYELNGFVRGVFFGGKIPEEDKAEMKSGYAEAALKMRIRKQDFGNGFAEIRFRKGNESRLPVQEVQLREAYVDAFIGRFDFRIGQQIVVWGRADGYNPTNNITPQNMLVRSPDEDDRRVGNFLIRSSLNLHPLRMELLWMPAYSASVLPTQIIPLPPDVTLRDMDPISADFENSSFAIKANLEFPVFDGSISYYHGYAPLPGIHGESEGVSVITKPKPYRMDVLGFDFSTTLGATGFRGEFAYRNPEGDYEHQPHIINPDLQTVLGIDKTWGDFNLILQYIGRYVFDFSELVIPSSPVDLPEYELNQKNRMIAGQQEELIHSASFRPSWTLFHETMTVELAGLYNFTTEELLLRPKLTYDIADALTVSAGGEIYSGPDETLYGTIDEALSAAFIEIRASF